jgi:hypothetical protein
MGKRAKYQTSVSEEKGILEVVITGQLTESDADKITEEVSTISKSSSAEGLLVDVRYLKHSIGFTKTYERVRNYPPHMYKIPFAMVDIPENNDFQSFHETTALNAGLQFKWFTDIDAARAWLKSKKKGHESL